MIFVNLQISFKSFQRVGTIYRNYGAKKKYPFKPFTMPKDNATYLRDLQMQRRRQKVLAAKYPPAQIVLHVSFQIFANSSSSSYSCFLFEKNTLHEVLVHTFNYY